MLKTKKTEDDDYEVLLAGDSCYPVSPAEFLDSEDDSIQVSPEDQLIKIIELVGPQTIEQMKFCDNKDSVYLVDNISSQISMTKPL